MKLKAIGCILASLLPPCFGFAQSTSFQDGQRARAEWETWFDALANDRRAGAYYWSGQRSLPNPGSCYGPDGQARGDWTIGCMAAQIKLAPLDIRRKAESDYRAGWNSPPSTPEVATPTLPQAQVRPLGVASQNIEVAPSTDRPFMTWSGAGMQNTRPFRIDTPWELSWTSERFFSVYLMNVSDGSTAGVFSGDHSGTTYVPKGGNYYLSVNSFGQWTMAGKSLPEFTSIPSTRHDRIPSDADDEMALVGDIGTHDNLPACDRPGWEKEIGSLIGNGILAGALHLKVLDFIKVRKTSTKSGVEICHATVMTNAGMQYYSYHYTRYENGKIYVLGMPEDP